MVLVYHKKVCFPVFIRIFRTNQTCLEAIFSLFLAALDSNPPEASGAVVHIYVLLPHRSAAIEAVRFRTVCIKGRNHPLHSEPL